MSGASPAVLLFGGSFNPIHHGHLIVARSAAEQIGASRVILAPAATPPHKPVGDLLNAAQRLEMCRLAVAGDPLFEVCSWETEQSGPNYTLLTVRHFVVEHPNWRLHWLIGMDSLLELHTWHRVAELVDACTIVTAARPGAKGRELSELRSLLSDSQLAQLQAHILPTPQIEISASQIRARIRAGESIRYVVPDSVAAYIREHQLYHRGG